jgi:two-component system response regulator DctR
MNEELNPAGTVVLVEDDASLTHALETLLRFDGFEVLSYSDPRVFLASVCREDSACLSKPTCILMDLNLNSTLDGLECFTEARSRPLNALPPFVFLTGHGELEVGLQAMRQGAFDFLTKPTKSEALLKRIREAIESHRSILVDQERRGGFIKAYKDLTDKQLEIFHYLMEGFSNKEIAEKVGTSTRTVEIHRSAVLEKMGGYSLVEIGRLYEKYRAAL